MQACGLLNVNGYCDPPVGLLATPVEERFKGSREELLIIGYHATASAAGEPAQAAAMVDRIMVAID